MRSYLIGKAAGLLCRPERPFLLFPEGVFEGFNLVACHAFHYRQIPLLLEALFALELDQVTRPFRLSFQVEAVVSIGRDYERDASCDFDTKRRERLDLARVVGDQLDRPDLERVEHMRGR